MKYKSVQRNKLFKHKRRLIIVSCFRDMFNNATAILILLTLKKINKIATTTVTNPYQHPNSSVPYTIKEDILMVIIVSFHLIIIINRNHLNLYLNHLNHNLNTFPTCNSSPITDNKATYRAKHHPTNQCRK